MSITEAVIKNMDHLGLVAGMVDELEIVKSIDTMLPSNDPHRKMSMGELTKAMILNGLGYTNKQLYLTPMFFKDKPLNRLFHRSVEAEWINDDALGRTLDAMYAYGVSQLYTKIAAKAIHKLNLTVDTIHLDSTSFHLDGQYANQNKISDEEQACIYITKGYSRDHHPDLNQVVLNLIAEHKAGIPLWIQPANGNQNDTKAFTKIVDTHIASMRAVYDEKLTIIADAALFTKETIVRLHKSDLSFISRVPATNKEARGFLKEQDNNDFFKLDENYQVIQRDIEYEGFNQRWFLFKSHPATKRENETIKKSLSKESTKELKAIQKFGKQSLFCKADAQEALLLLKQTLSIIEIVDATLETIPKFKTKGRPKANASPDYYEYRWNLTIASPLHILQTRQDEKSGLFILATNDMNLTAQTVLEKYKSQQRVERGFRFLKSPQFLSDALFLKKPERIEALLMVMTLSLLVYAALEYRIRTKLKEQNKTFPNQLGKPVQNPTTRWIFENFFAIHLLLFKNEETIVGLNERHRLVLELLGSTYMLFYGLG